MSGSLFAYSSVSHRFQSELPALYVPEGFAPETALELPSDELQHLRALRLRPGDRMLLLDGRGHRTTALLEAVDKRSAVARTGPVIFDGVGAGPYIALSFGLLADKSRLEWCIEKCVELGVRHFIPLETERSEGRMQRSRLERVAIAALKQSQRAWLPEIDEPSRVGALAAHRRDVDRFYICHESAPLDAALVSMLHGDEPGRVLIAVGPEGGFSDREVQEMVAMNGALVSLGDARLRAETAAIAAVTLVQMTMARARPEE